MSILTMQVFLDWLLEHGSPFEVILHQRDYLRLMECMPPRQVNYESVDVFGCTVLPAVNVTAGVKVDVSAEEIWRP